MRALLIGVVIIVLLFVAGWLTFRNEKGEPSVNIETEKVEQDTDELVEGGRRLVEKVDEKVDVEIKE